MHEQCHHYHLWHLDRRIYVCSWSWLLLSLCRLYAVQTSLKHSTHSACIGVSQCSQHLAGFTSLAKQLSHTDVCQYRADHTFQHQVLTVVISMLVDFIQGCDPPKYRKRPFRVFMTSWGARAMFKNNCTTWGCSNQLEFEPKPSSTAKVMANIVWYVDECC